MKRKITSFILCLAMLVSVIAVLPLASAAADTTLAGTDVTLTDGIILNFYIEADEALGIDNVPLVDGYYVVTKALAAKEMGDDVTVELKSGETVVGEYTYSVADYAAGILAGNYTDATKALVTAMLNYGAAAQKYFNYDVENLVGTPVSDTAALLAAEVEDAVINDVSEIFIGASLVLEGTMKLRFYFKGNDLDVTIGGNDVEKENRDGYCYVETEITPDQINDTFEIIAQESIISYSPLNYLKSAAQDPALAEIAASIYAYGVAADAYLEEACDHDGVEYEYKQLPTLFNKGVRIAHCDNCGEILTESLDKNKADLNEVPLGTNNNTLYETAHIGTALGDKTFYPTADDPDGNDLYAEFSILLNEDISRLKVDCPEFGSIYNAENVYDNAGKTDKVFSYIYTRPNTKWCNFLGGIYLEGGKFSLDGGETWKTSQNGNTKEDFPMAGNFDGWHRIGFRYHQNVYEDNGTFTYDVSIFIYVDGVEVAEMLMDWGSYFYSAERVGDNVVYTQNSNIANYYVGFYRYGRADITTGSDKVYFPVGDCILSVGDDFVLDVSPVENPEAQDFTQDGVTLPGKQYYELNVD